MTKRNREFESRPFFHDSTKLEQSDGLAIITKSPPRWSARASAQITFAVSIQVEFTLCLMPTTWIITLGETKQLKLSDISFSA